MAVPETCASETAVFPPWAIKPDPLPALKPAGRGVSLIIDGVSLANFQSVSSSGGEAERIDVTTHDTPGRYREFRPSFASEITLDFSIIYDPTHPSHRYLAFLFQTGQVVPIVIQIWNRELPEPGAEILTTGFISAFPVPNFPIDGPYDATIQVTVSGEVTFPGAGDEVVLGKPIAAYHGCPGVWLPSETTEPAPTFAQLAGKIAAFPSSAWAADAHVVTSDGKRAQWNGKAWIEQPPTTTPGKATEVDYTGASAVWTKGGQPATAPTTKVQLDKVTTVKPTGQWPQAKKVSVGSKDYRWDGSAWQEVILATGVDNSKPEHKFTPAGAEVPENLAALRALNITPANPAAAWKQGEFVGLGKGTDTAYWAGSAATPQWVAGKAPA